MIKKAVKYFLLSLLVYSALAILTPFSSFLTHRSIQNQISYLSKTLDKGADIKLQNKFPEGKVFSNALLALSIIEYAENNTTKNEEQSPLVDRCISRLLSNQALRTFDSYMTPKYGMFYNGWTLHVLSEYRKSPLYNYSTIKELVSTNIDTIQNRLISTQLDSMRILESYSGSYWPADNLIGLISVANDTIQKQWLSTMLEATDHPSSLIHHTGSNKSIIRGSSQALTTYCLTELGHLDIVDYYRTYEKYFIDR